MTRLGVRSIFVANPARREACLADLAALSTRGVDALRLRVNWADVFPTDTRIDSRLVEDLVEFVTRVTAVGYEVWPTLCGNKLPGWFLNEGAFADKKATDRFWSRYVDTIAGAIADHATGWIPFESPITLLHEGWRVGLRDPGIADESKFADAFGGIINSLAVLGRLLGDTELLLAIDSAHPGATTEVIEVFREATMRGRLALPGRITRDIPGLQGAYSHIGLSLPDNSCLESGDALNRWRDATVKQVYATAERFASLPVSIVAIPDTSTDTQHADLIEVVRSATHEVRDGGAELRYVWLGDATAVAGLVGSGPDGHDLAF